MSRTRRQWVIFGLCMAAVLGALGVVTRVTLDLEASEQRWRRESEFEDSLRRALWRMDSLLSPILALETARPPIHYSSYYSPSNSYDSKSNLFNPSNFLVASPLLAATPAFVRLHFRVDEYGQITSPQVPIGQVEDTRQISTDWAESISAASVTLEQLRALRVVSKLRVATGETGASRGAVAQVQQQEQSQLANPYPSRSPKGQSVEEYQSRRNSTMNSARVLSNDLDMETEAVPLLPVWHDRGPVEDRRPVELFLVRSFPSRAGLQGIWFDWDGLKKHLLNGVRDLFPAGDLKALDPTELASQDQGKLLASLPVAFTTGPLPRSEGVLWTPTRITLLVSWLAVLGAGIAAGLVLHASVDLGERRGRFVSAVTHELRTPLTTFRMYSQMLADGMITDPTARQEYLDTLRGESERLARVVESVLIYSRLEEGRGGAHRTRIASEALLDAVLAPLVQRALDSDMELVCESDGLEGVFLEVDAQAVEQILLNLVDNSCKYARDAVEPKLFLRVRRDEKQLVFDYHDHGPGISDSEIERIFRPFHRSAQHEGGPIPGVGLGLSLARGLARGLGGDLRAVRHQGQGAAFRLSLPVV